MKADPLIKYFQMYISARSTYLFIPLSINAYAWYAFPNAPEMTVASSTLYLRLRDMANIGQMFLDGGIWNGTRIFCLAGSGVASNTILIFDGE